MARKNNDASQEPVPSETRIPKLALSLTPDGSSLDFSHIRDTTKTKLCDIIEAQREEIYRQAGRVAPGVGVNQAEPEGNLFGEITLENVSKGLDLLSQFNSLAISILAPKFVKHPFRVDRATGKPVPMVIDPDILQASFTLTEAQHKELDPRALEEVKRYSGHMPEWMKKHLNLVLLVTMYLKYTGDNTLNAIKAQTLRDLSKAQAAAQPQRKSRPIDTDRSAAKVPDEPAAEFPPPTGNGGISAEL